MRRIVTDRRVLMATMVAVLVGSVVTWLVTRERLPRQIRIAAGVRGGLYVAVAEHLAARMTEATGRPVTVVDTAGSEANGAALRDGRAELAIIQSGAVDLPRVATLAPLYDDVVFLVARRERGIGEMADLRGRHVALGPPGSGMRASARLLLEHFGIPETAITGADAYFGTALDDPRFDAALVTTGLLNPDLERLLATDAFDIVPIRDALAFSIRHPRFHPYTIPPGLYGEAPRQPEGPVASLATMAVLAGRGDIATPLVEEALDALYGTDLRRAVPTLLPRGAAGRWQGMILHPAARRYFDPFGGLGRFADFMESLAAGKELLFAFGAGLYLLWERRRRSASQARAATLGRMKERLDRFLDETARIEEAQMGLDDASALAPLLDEVTRIKLEALRELTHEDLRGDRMFLIFLLQCGNLISKLQRKIAQASRDHA